MDWLRSPTCVGYVLSVLIFLLGDAWLFQEAWDVHVRNSGTLAALYLRRHRSTWQFQSHWRAVFTVILFAKPFHPQCKHHTASAVCGRRVCTQEKETSWRDRRRRVRVVWWMLACDVHLACVFACPLPRVEGLFAASARSAPRKPRPAVPIHLILSSLTHRARHPRTCRELARVPRM